MPTLENRISAMRRNIKAWNNRHAPPPGGGLARAPGVRSLQMRQNWNRELRHLLLVQRAVNKFKVQRAKSHTRRRAPNENLSKAVFSPARMRTMMNKYGMNWSNRV